MVGGESDGWVTGTVYLWDAPGAKSTSMMLVKYYVCYKTLQRVSEKKKQ